MSRVFGAMAVAIVFGAYGDDASASEVVVDSFAATTNPLFSSSQAKRRA